MAKFIVVTISLGLILIVSMIGSLPVLLWGGTGSDYFATCCILIALQLFIGKIWNYFIDKRLDIHLEQAKASSLLAESLQYLSTNCAYCGTTNLVQIIVGKDNTFECTACKQKNLIMIETSCARITTPVIPKADLNSIFSSIDNTPEKETDGE